MKSYIPNQSLIYIYTHLLYVREHHIPVGIYLIYTTCGELFCHSLTCCRLLIIQGEMLNPQLIGFVIRIEVESFD